MTTPAIMSHRASCAVGHLVAAALSVSACGAGATRTAPEDFAACTQRAAECEASCAPAILPGSSEKEPALRGDIEAERCHERCRSCAP